MTRIVAVATALLFGTAPALRASRVAPNDALKEQGRGALGDTRSLASGLVVAQVALARSEGLKDVGVPSVGESGVTRATAGSPTKQASQL